MWAASPSGRAELERTAPGPDCGDTRSPAPLSTVTPAILTDFEGKEGGAMEWKVRSQQPLNQDEWLDIRIANDTQLSLFRRWFKMFSSIMLACRGRTFS